MYSRRIDTIFACRKVNLRIICVLHCPVHRCFDTFFGTVATVASLLEPSGTALLRPIITFCRHPLPPSLAVSNPSVPIRLPPIRDTPPSTKRNNPNQTDQTKQTHHVGDRPAGKALREAKVASHRRQRLPGPSGHQRGLGALLQGGLQLRPGGDARHGLPGTPEPVRRESREGGRGRGRRREGGRRGGRAGETGPGGAAGADRVEEQRDVRLHTRGVGFPGVSGWCLGVGSRAIGSEA